MPAITKTENEAAGGGIGSPIPRIPASSSSGVEGVSSSFAGSSSGAKKLTSANKKTKTGSSGSERGSARHIRGLVKSGWSSVRGKKKKSKRKDSDGNSVYSTPAASIAIDSNYETELENAFLESTPMKIKVETTDTGASSGGLDLVVLLMDPISHRFELLQLEFDEKLKAKVSDLLTQIPISVTEPSLKSIVYDGILDHNYYRSSAAVALDATAVVVSSKDNDAVGRGQYKVLPSSRIIEAFGGNGSTDTATTTSSSKSKSKTATPNTKMVLVARPTGVSDAETLRLARPILTNKDVSKMLELSGFDVSGWKSKKFPSNKADVDINKTTTSTGGISKNGLAVVGGKVVSIKQASTVKNSWTSLCVLSIVVLLIVGNLMNSIMIQPIPSGVLLKPGIKSKCGISGYVTYFTTPTIKQTTKNIFDFVSVPLPDFLSCEDEFFVVGRRSTIMYNSKNKISMIFTVSGGDNTFNGLTMNNNDHSLEMGSKTIKQVLIHDKSHRVKKLSPWPFEVEPTKLRYKLAQRY